MTCDYTCEKLATACAKKFSMRQQVAGICSLKERRAQKNNWNKQLAQDNKVTTAWQRNLAHDTKVSAFCSLNEGRRAQKNPYDETLRVKTPGTEVQLCHQQPAGETTKEVSRPQVHLCCR